MQYRREIDGLRAIAVLPVILFHAGFSLFSGGFVGVDVFFVISGYLITGKLIEDLDRGTFSLARFYEGRARRILPALSLVVLCSIPFAWRWLPPLQFQAFCDSVIAVTLFVSNILFWHEAGYFAPASELKPLLHSWSLAIEEQYYLLFPAALLVAWRFGRKRAFWFVVAAAAASLALCLWASRYAPSANFFLAPTRAWELLTGSISAFLAHERQPKAGNLASLSGLLLVALPIFAFDSSTPFPGAYALAPVGGTALILLYGRSGTLAARLLSSRVLVGVGLVSYSAYLWHWPLLAFARLRTLGEPEMAVKIALAAASLGLAALSWKFVEQPFRKRARPPLPTRRTVLAASLATAIVFLSAGIAGHLSGGAPFRIAPSGRSFAASSDEEQLRRNNGLDEVCDGLVISSKCRTGEHPQLVLWGDSFAMHLADALESSPTAAPFEQMTKSGCAPIPGIATDSPWSRWRDCIEFNDAAFRRIIANRDTKVVVLSSTFGILRTEFFDRQGKWSQSGPGKIAQGRLLRTIDELRDAGKAVVIVSPTPMTTYDVGQCLLTAEALGVSRERCDFSKPEYANRTRSVYGMLKRHASRAPVVWLDALLCPENVCRASVGGVLIYRTGGHLTHEGSAYLGRKYDLMGRIYQAAGARAAKPP